MRIVSWNVNGLRAAANKGFFTWLAKERSSIVGVQEVRAEPAQLDFVAARAPRHAFAVVAARRKGYSGVGLFSPDAPDELITSLGGRGFDASHFDDEGRLQLARFGRLWVANVYVPNGNGKERDNSRIPYKLAFQRRLFSKLQPLLKRNEHVLVMGDFNTAHREVDLARPKDNTETSGFTPEERASLDELFDAGWVDTFRHFHPSARDRYSWWSQRFGVRARNVGWRIDLVVASPGAMKHLQGAFIDAHVKGSDHCPVGVRASAGLIGRR